MSAGRDHPHGDGGAVRELPQEEARGLDPAVRARFERSLDADFGDVVVHTGPASSAAALEKRAAAFTVGRHIVVGAGHYHPASVRGRMLLGHELAHIVQQRRGAGLTGPAGPVAEASADAAAAHAAVGLPGQVGGAAPVGIARQDEEHERSWRDVLTEKLRDKAKETLGEVEGVALEAGQIVDTLAWVGSKGTDLADSAIEWGGKQVGASKETIKAVQAFNNPQFKALRKEAAERGMVDPVTGAPIISGKITALGDLAEKALDTHVFAGVKEEDSFFTSREVGQLQGAIGAQIALSFVGVEEIQLALKAVSGIGAAKAIVDAIERNPKDFTHDRAFWTAVANAVLHVAGLSSASAGKKIVTLVVDVLSVTLSTGSEIMQLREDLALPPGEERDKAIRRDVQALIKALVGAVQQAISHGKSLKKAGAGARPETPPADASATPTTPPTTPKRVLGPPAPPREFGPPAPRTAPEPTSGVPDHVGTTPARSDVPARVATPQPTSDVPDRVATPPVRSEVEPIPVVDGPAGAGGRSERRVLGPPAPEHTAPGASPASRRTGPAAADSDVPVRSAAPAEKTSAQKKATQKKAAQKAARTRVRATGQKKQLLDQDLRDARTRIRAAEKALAAAQTEFDEATRAQGTATAQTREAVDAQESAAKASLEKALSELDNARERLPALHDESQAADRSLTDARAAAQKADSRPGGTDEAKGTPATPAEDGAGPARKEGAPKEQGAAQKQERARAEAELLAAVREKAEQMRREAATDPGAADQLQNMYEGLPDSILKKLGNDQRAKAELDRRRGVNRELAKVRLSDDRITHEAVVRVEGADGTTVVAPRKLRSGGLAEENKASGKKWPQSALDSHTEAKAVDTYPLKAGQTMRIDGQYDPCGSCQRRMQAAAASSGATIVYWWPGGPPGGMRFEPPPKKAQ